MISHGDSGHKQLWLPRRKLEYYSLTVSHAPGIRTLARRASLRPICLSWGVLDHESYTAVYCGGHVAGVSVLGLVISYWRQSTVFRSYEEYAPDAQTLAGRL